MGRQLPLSVLRIAGALAIVVLHVSGRVISATEPGSLNWWIGNVFNGATRWAVPVFVMISGALLLDPAKEISDIAFLKRRASRIAVPLILWSAFGLWLRSRDQSMTIGFALKEILRGEPYTHLWFLYMIGGLYLATPVMRRFVATASTGEQLIGSATVLILAGAYKLANASLFHNTPTVFGMFVPFIGYYLAGPALNALRPSRFQATIAAGIAFCACLSVSLGTGLLFHMKYRAQYCLYDEFSPLVVVAAAGVFMAVSGRMRDRDESRHTMADQAHKIADATFGIYIVHVFLLDWVCEANVIIGSLCSRPLTMVPTISIGIFVAALLTVTAVQQVPCLRRVLP